MSDVKDKVLEIIASRLDRPKDSIKLDSKFQDLGFDSIEVVELTMDLDDTFGITISDEETEGLSSVGDLIQFIEEKLKEKSS